MKIGIDLDGVLFDTEDYPNSSFIKENASLVKENTINNYVNDVKSLCCRWSHFCKSAGTL